MDIAKLSKRNHYEHITEQLKRLIVDGELKPGDKLPSTKELSERFGVGRSTMREALSALKAMGLIDVRQGGASTVLAPPAPGLESLESLVLNKRTILDLLEARQSFEIANAGLAARKRTEDDLAAFRVILDDMRVSLGDEEAGERTDLAFHRQLAAATRNSVLPTLFEAVSSQMELAIRETRRAELYANRSVSDRLYLEHVAIFEAVERGDPPGAESRMREHLEHVESILMKHLQLLRKYGEK
ncbi:FadR family transcriptional regulator [Paenibacillus antri]|uniref:FadR family transcriptional regulator n=1 Tax=Paenibacillus antri TaxID=2582848 RepID=A0A5R9G737_9BACL|nr:FadR/GntR family transcriptional regulator [Paenibacillus antri]TLS48553.1 FadR family transcriptional regulator [Paenibacillus antri]